MERKKNHVVSYEDDQGEGHSLGMIKRLAALSPFFSFFAEWADLSFCVPYACMTSTGRQINKQAWKA